MNKLLLIPLLLVGCCLFAEDEDFPYLNNGEGERKELAKSSKGETHRYYVDLTRKYVSTIYFKKDSFGTFRQSTLTKKYYDVNPVSAEVFQVIDEENVLIKIKKNYVEKYKPYGDFDNPSGFRKYSETPSGTHYEDKIFLLSIDTTNLADGDEYKLDKIYKCIGTVKYETRFGTRTVFQFKKF